MKSAHSSSRRSRSSERRVIRITGAVLAAAITTALATAVPTDAVAAPDVRAGVPDLADRVAALRQLLAEKSSLVEGNAAWSDQALIPGTKLSQWKKWNNG